MERRTLLRLPVLVLALVALAPLRGAQSPSGEKNLHADLIGPGESLGTVDVRGSGTQRYVKVELFKIPVDGVRVRLGGTSFPVRIDPATGRGVLLIDSAALDQSAPLDAGDPVFVIFNGRIVMRGVLKPVP